MEKMKMGITPAKELAAISPQKVPQGVSSCPTATGRVFVLNPDRMRAKGKSFQEKMMQKMAVATRPGAARGSVIRVKAERKEHPSIQAYSSSSLGISLKKPRIIQQAKAVLNVE